MQDIQIAYSGIEGSFSCIAASRIFPDAKLIPFHSFKEAYHSVTNGDCDAAVLPIENSYAGEVGQVSDLMFAGDLMIQGVYELSISQCLLGLPGSTISDIRQVISHPQALEQCGEYIGRHGWKMIPYENTARAARAVARESDITQAAVASAETAELYGLTILEKDINESTQNTTRFAVFTKEGSSLGASAQEERSRDFASPEENKKAEDVQVPCNTILLFTIKHVAGSLAKAVSIIGLHDYNMRVIRSRPAKDMNWQYYFYTELEGSLDTIEGQAMLAGLRCACELIKIVGTYRPDMTL
ncbi:MAG: bifunctional chorismate mutase/prephenate dehydratase [Clostridiales bacterium]|nr:bifunctional chorismate mutase/prephenate dehydratase [Clostridiales bacterium]